MWRNAGLKFGIFISVLILCWAVGSFFNFDIDTYRNWLNQYPLFISGLLFVLLYVGVTFFVWLAKDLFKVVGAFLFGAWWSTFFIWIAEMINAAILFHLSRFLGRDFVQKRLLKKSEFLNDRISSRGFWGIFALRAIPVVPYRFLDLLAGLSTISFRKYFIIVLVGSPLRIFWIQFVLEGVGEVVLKNPTVLMDYLLKNQGMFLWSFTYLIAAIILLINLKRK